MDPVALLVIGKLCLEPKEEIKNLKFSISADHIFTEPNIEIGENTLFITDENISSFPDKSIHFCFSTMLDCVKTRPDIFKTWLKYLKEKLNKGVQIIMTDDLDSPHVKVFKIPVVSQTVSELEGKVILLPRFYRGIAISRYMYRRCENIVSFGYDIKPPFGDHVVVFNA
jgi:hypothetical protein